MEGIPYYMYIALSHLFTSKKANFKFRNDVAQLQVDYVERSYLASCPNYMALLEHEYAA